MRSPCPSVSHNITLCDTIAEGFPLSVRRSSAGPSVRLPSVSAAFPVFSSLRFLQISFDTALSVISFWNVPIHARVCYNTKQYYYRDYTIIITITRARFNEITEKPIKTGKRGFSVVYCFFRGVSSVLVVPDDNGGFLPECATLEEKTKDTAAGADRPPVVSSSCGTWGRSPGAGGAVLRWAVFALSGRLSVCSSSDRHCVAVAAWADSGASLCLCLCLTVCRSSARCCCCCCSFFFCRSWGGPRCCRSCSVCSSVFVLICPASRRPESVTVRAFFMLWRRSVVFSETDKKQRKKEKKERNKTENRVM